MGRGSDRVVIVLTFYSDNPSSSPAEVYSFSLKFVFERNENKAKKILSWADCKLKLWSMKLSHWNVKTQVKAYSIFLADMEANQSLLIYFSS